MSKFRFVNIIDTIFIYLATLLIFFAWLQFFIKNISLSLIASILLTIVVIYFIRILKSRKQTKYLNTTSKNNELLKFRLTIQTMPNNQLISLIKQLIPSKYQAKTVRGDIHVLKENSLYIFTCYWCCELTENTLLDIIKNKQSNNITIFCLSFNNSILSTCKAFKNKSISLINIEQLYELFSKHNISIDTNNIDFFKHKITLLEILKDAISRNKSKGYFVSGLVLLFTSLIIPYKIYYVVFSSILFTLSLICRLKSSTPPATKNIID